MRRKALTVVALTISLSFVACSTGEKKPIDPSNTVNPTDSMNSEIPDQTLEPTPEPTPTIPKFTLTQDINELVDRKSVV